MKLGRLDVAVISGTDAADLQTNLEAFLDQHGESEMVGEPLAVGDFTIVIFYIALDGR